MRSKHIGILHHKLDSHATDKQKRQVRHNVQKVGNAKSLPLIGEVMISQVLRDRFDKRYSNSNSNASRY